MGWKFIILVAILVVGGVGYYLWNQVPDTPKEQTLTGYTQGLKSAEDKAAAAASTANLDNVRSALEKYKSLKGANPATLQDLVPEYIDHIPGGVQYDAASGTISAAQ